MIYDTIIIGGGPAGLTAALYTARRAMKTLVLARDIGGQMVTTDFIENYPGVEKANGGELTKRFLKQAKSFGAEVVFAEVTKIEKKNREFVVRTKENEIHKSRTIILAFGKSPRLLKVPGEKEFRNKGVCYCATCDAPLFAGKKVAVAGGGNSALEAALLLADVASRVYLVHRRGEFRAEEVLVKRVLKNSRIKFLPHQVVKEIKGGKFVEKLILENVQTKKKSELEVKGLFVEVGSEVKTDFLKGLVKLGPKGEVLVDKFAATSAPGIFAAGDVTSVPYQQIVISAGEAAKAALSASAYLKGQKLGKTEGADWGKLRKG